MIPLWVYLPALLVAFSVHCKAQCNADNCYRAMFPCRTMSATAYRSATQYCDTRTFEGQTRTNYPTHATAACNSNQDKIFSACDCGPLCTPQQGPCTPPAAPIGAVFYDSLDCQLPEVEKRYPTVRYALLDNAFNGRAFKTWLSGGGNEAVSFRDPILVHYRNVPVQRNKVVKISGKVQFRHGDAGAIQVRTDEGRIKEGFITPLDSPVWSDYSVNFTAQSDTISFTIAFLFSTENAWIKLDDILVTYIE